jgi:Fe-Mn family superoxide dismutase
MKKSLLSLILVAIFAIGTMHSQTLQKLSDSKKPADSKIVEHPFNPLPYSYDALEKAIDSKTMNIHYNKHFRSYYDKFLKAIEGKVPQCATMPVVTTTTTCFGR